MRKQPELIGGLLVSQSNDPITTVSVSCNVSISKLVNLIDPVDIDAVWLQLLPQSALSSLKIYGVEPPIIVSPDIATYWPHKLIDWSLGVISPHGAVDREFGFWNDAYADPGFVILLKSPTTTITPLILFYV